MDERERVRKAVEGPVAEAVKLLDEARSADTETRLMMLVNGWGRGLAAGLEELALAIDELRRLDSPESSTHTASDDVQLEPTDVPKQADPNASDEPDDEELDEEGLRVRAAESRAATAALREEASSERDDDRATSDD
jgi:hypothetical protein